MNLQLQGTFVFGFV